MPCPLLFRLLLRRSELSLEECGVGCLFFQGSLQWRHPELCAPPYFGPCLDSLLLSQLLCFLSLRAFQTGIHRCDEAPKLARPPWSQKSKILKLLIFPYQFIKLSVSQSVSWEVELTTNHHFFLCTLHCYGIFFERQSLDSMA